VDRVEHRDVLSKRGQRFWRTGAGHRKDAVFDTATRRILEEDGATY